MKTVSSAPGPSTESATIVRERAVDHSDEWLRPPPAPTPVPETRAQLGFGMLGYFAGLTLMMTLAPFAFEVPKRFTPRLDLVPADVLVNVLLFLPLGFLFQVSRRESRIPSTLPAFLFGALFSAAIEFVQLFEPVRYSTPWDVLCNAAGAWIGALIYGAAVRRTSVDARLVSRLALELPLVGLLYLLIPMLWMAAGSPLAVVRTGGTLILTAFVASLLGGLHRFHLGPSRSFTPRASALIAGFWCLVGTAPALMAHPFVAVGATVSVVPLTYWRATRPVPIDRIDRRYERAVLGEAAAWFVGLVLLLATAPLLRGVSPWSIHISFAGFDAVSARETMSGLLTSVSAFSLLGYMHAEANGRRHERTGDVLRRFAPVAITGVLLFEGIAGFSRGGASIARVTLELGGAALGAWLYLLQRAHVVHLLSVERSRSR